MHRTASFRSAQVATSLLLCVGLAACATVEGPAATGQKSAVVSAAAMPAGDPIATYVRGVAPGTTGFVSSASGRETKVHVGDEYTSAAGNRCRRIILSDTSRRNTQVSAVCLKDEGWSTVIGL